MYSWYDENSPQYQALFKRLLIVFSLGFSSGLPFALTSSTLQAWFADSGRSIMMTGMISLLGLPYLLRFLWSPFLDRYALFPIGKRRSWIICMQLVMIIALNLLAYCTPNESPITMLCLALLISFCSSTQDVAIDAHRVEYLQTFEHGLGASLASLGFRIALLTAGGVALIIAKYFGWIAAYRLMSCFLLIGVITVFKSPEPSRITNKAVSLKDSIIEPFKELLARPGIVTLVFFIVFFKLGEAFTTSTSGILMPFLIQGLHFSLDSIAYAYNGVGILSVVLGGLLAGVLLMKWSLYRALFCFGLLQAMTNLAFFILALVGNNIYVLYTGVILDNFAAGMGTTALVAFLMRLVNTRFTGTQFSILVAFSILPRIVSGPIAAWIQLYIDWTGLFFIIFILSFMFIPFLICIKKNKEFSL